MKSKSFTLLITATLLTTLNSQLASTFAQGSLTPPPGAPAPVMKSLDQIESRIPVNTLPGASNAVHVISQPGNYYLTGDIVGSTGKNGILINAHDVTIDLNGYTLLGSGNGSLDGIRVLEEDGGSGERLIVRNGKIQKWGGAAISMFAHYVQALQDLDINDCGAGIGCSGAAIVERCRLISTGRYGILMTSAFSRIKDCSVNSVYNSDGPASGISVYFGTVEDSSVNGVWGAPGHGIQVEWTAGKIQRCLVNQIHSFSGNGAGIAGTSVIDCTVSYVSASTGSATGIAGQQIERCTINKISGTGASAKAYGIRGSHTSGVIEQCAIDDINANSAYGISIFTNSYRIVASQIHNVAATGGYAAGIDSESGAALFVSACNVSGITNSGDSSRGILAYNGQVENCSVSNTKGVGIYANGSVHVLNCRVTGVRNGYVGAAFCAGSLGNRLTGNLATSSDVGFQISLGTAGCVLSGNVARSNTTNYSVPASNVAPTVNAAGVAAATNPFMNLDL